MTGHGISRRKLWKVRFEHERSDRYESFGFGFTVTTSGIWMAVVGADQRWSVTFGGYHYEEEEVEAVEAEPVRELIYRLDVAYEVIKKFPALVESIEKLRETLDG